MNNLTLTHTIKAINSMGDMSKRQKIRLMDQALNPKDETKRGLIIDMEISAAGKLINNRIYSTWGQRDGIASLTSDFEKPISIDHSTSAKDTIGRITSGRYIDRSQDAVRFFGRLSDMQNLYRAVESKDYEESAKFYHQSGVLLRKDWRGLGAMEGSALITDESAIERFLDQRFLTFSGGFTTDRMICTHCFTDWKVSGYCDHEPGTIVDGKIVAVMCGTYQLDELSVVSNPASKTSVIKSFRFKDSEDPEWLSKLTDSEEIAEEVSMTASPAENLSENTEDKKEEPVKAEGPAVVDKPIEIDFSVVLNKLDELASTLSNKDQLDSLALKYKSAVEIIGSNNKKLQAVLSKVTGRTVDMSELDNVLDKYLSDANESKILDRVENPSVSGSDPTKPTNNMETLDSYTKQTILRYKEIAKTNKAVATAWLNQLKLQGYLRKDLDPNKYN